MKREDHMKEAHKLQEEAMNHLNKVSAANGLGTDWVEYKRLSRMANKHFGIAKAISTREINKIKSGR